MFLLTTALESANYKLKPLDNQPSVLEGTTYPLEDISIEGPIAQCAKSPLGAIFAVMDHSYADSPDVMKINASNVVPIMHKDTIYPLSTLSTEQIQTVSDYLIDYMLEEPDTYEQSKVEQYAKELSAYGYNYDWKKKTEISEVDFDKVSGSKVKRSIMAKYPAPKLEDCGFYVDPNIWFLLVRNVLRGENILLTGPSGTGKTELIEHLAKVMAKPLNIQDMGTIFDAQSSLLGVHRIGKSGASEFEFAPFAKYIQEESIILLDEINRSTLASNNVLFPCLDRRRYLPVDVACDECDRQIPVHEKVSFIATANIGNEYSGTQQIDRALMDRFFIVELDYLEEKDEVNVLVKRTGVEERYATSIVKVATKVRDQYKKQEFSNAISIRHNLQAASLVRDGFDLDQALLSTVLPLFQDDLGTSERSKIKSIIAAF